MTPSSPTMSSRPTSVDMRAIQRCTSASSHIVDRRRQCRPINPAKIVVEHPSFATIALRTFSRVSPTPAPPAASAALNAPHERPTPIGRGEPPAASFNPASNRSRFITRGRLLRRGTYLNPQAFKPGMSPGSIDSLERMTPEELIGVVRQCWRSRRWGGVRDGEPSCGGAAG